MDWRRNAFLVHLNLSLFIPCLLYAQPDTNKIELKEITISAYKEEEAKATSLNIEPLTLKEIKETGAFNLSDALSKKPGISQLSTGVAISKPVIRGLYGNRVLILLSGLRFDNQQWQDEHGLGLSEIGISRMEIIKGPFSLLYGTDAVGGVINIIEEEKAALQTQEIDAGLKFNSNTLGGIAQGGFKVNYGNIWFRARVAAESNADYSDGNNSRILNSRFDGYYAKGSIGFRHKNWTSENHYHFSKNDFGFIFNDINDFFYPDERWSRSLNGPHHTVLLNLFSSENSFTFKKSALKVNAGFQVNIRKEDEGAGKISLNMHLTTGQYLLRWMKTLNEKTELIITNNTSFENNKNYGSRKIIPDADMMESSLSGYIKYHLTKSIFEIGANGGSRYIKTKLTPGVNSPEKEIAPFSINRPFGNGMLGWSFNPSNKWNVKINFSSGVRSPNLAELSSNGLHEGIFTYETGDPDLKNEQNINSETGINYSGKLVQWSVTGYYNHFLNYIYLQPLNTLWFGFPRYQFEQQDADLYGGEAELDFLFNPSLKLELIYSTVTGKTKDGNYLPYIPAQKISPGVRYELKKPDKNYTAYFFINSDLVFEQVQPAPNETFTPSYELLNAGAGTEFRWGNTPVEINLSGNNLLNRAYYDHLSRFKSFGLLNIGLTISLNIKIKFITQLKKI